MADQLREVWQRSIFTPEFIEQCEETPGVAPASRDMEKTEQREPVGCGLDIPEDALLDKGFLTREQLTRLVGDKISRCV